ncbi:hypothetical protein CDAR_285991 [Caerostris darwini]|uniref:Uncharacterized protein n=1 Tax=Caerostris darwini TaxID=1538125 RepID=A0AAV4N3S9_9ARAC|nr:hypothetical protein CDAR_285991 [Caerostris darwini]
MQSEAGTFHVTDAEAYIGSWADILPPSRIIVHAWLGSFHVGALGLRRMDEPAPRVCGTPNWPTRRFSMRSVICHSLIKTLQAQNDLPRRGGTGLTRAFFLCAFEVAIRELVAQVSRFSGSRSG